MIRLPYHTIKHMSTASKLFYQVSKQNPIQELVRLGKIKETESYTFQCHYRMLEMHVNGYVSKITKNVQIEQSDIVQDLDFTYNVMREAGKVKQENMMAPAKQFVHHLPSFNDLVQRSTCLPRPKKENIEGFLKSCSSLYSDSLDKNEIGAQICILVLLGSVIRDLSLTREEKLYLETISCH